MSNRVFYNTKIVMEVLTDGSINGMSLVQIAELIEAGDISAVIKADEPVVMNGLEAANELISRGHKLSLLKLNEQGNDVLEVGDLVLVDKTFGAWEGICRGFRQTNDGTILVQVEDQDNDVWDCDLEDVSHSVL